MVTQVGALAERVADAYASATANLTRAACNLFLGRHLQVEAHLQEAEELFATRCTGASWERGLLTTFRCGCSEQTGSFRWLSFEIPSREREARERRDQFSLGFLAQAVPLVHLMRDDPEAAEGSLVESRGRLTGAFDTNHFWVMQRTVDALLYQRAGRRALDFIEQAWPSFAGSVLARTELLRVSALFLRARSAIAADDARTARVLRDDLRALRAIGRQDALCLADLLESCRLIQKGQREGAARLLRTAVDHVDVHQMPVFSLYAQRLLGRIVGGEGGAASALEVDAALAAEGITAPERWCATWLPV